METLILEAQYNSDISPAMDCSDVLAFYLTVDEQMEKCVLDKIFPLNICELEFYSIRPIEFQWFVLHTTMILFTLIAKPIPIQMFPYSFSQF